MNVNIDCEVSIYEPVSNSLGITCCVAHLYFQNRDRQMIIFTNAEVCDATGDAIKYDCPVKKIG